MEVPSGQRFRSHLKQDRGTLDFDAARSQMWYGPGDKPVDDGGVGHPWPLLLYLC